MLPWQLPTPDTETAGYPYTHVLEWIYGFSEVPRSSAEIQFARSRKLDRMRTLLGLLGSPQAHFQTVLVAGTKGKGSTAACMTSILEAAGYRVGRYTQPHLYSFRERTWAGGRYISEDEVVEVSQAISPAVDLVRGRVAELGHLTSFDVGTALSLAHFARVGVEIAVVEVGVGGAHDATNALEPLLSLIGPVGMDHTDALGGTVGAIAREKAGIARHGIDVVVGRQGPEARSAIREVVHAVGARSWEFGRDFGWDASDPGTGAFAIHASWGTVPDVRMPLAGPCQRDNAAMAVHAAYLLGQRRILAADAIRGGLRRMDWPGRFQRVVANPLTIVDGAHNAAAAAALVETVRECLDGRPLNVVLGMSVEKDAAAFIRELAPLAHRAIVTRARHARSCDPHVLAAEVRREGIPTVVASSPQEALAHSWATVPENGVTLVTGSLFLVGDVLELLLHASEVAG